MGKTCSDTKLINLPNINLVQENTRRYRKGKKEKHTKVITQLPGFFFKTQLQGISI
jgi:hypothetical protein